MKTNWTKHWEENYGGLVWKTWVWRINRCYRQLLKGVTLSSSPSILELGSGTGINSILISRILDAGKITLVDFNQRVFDISRKIVADSGSELDVAYIASDVLGLDLNEQFDVVHSEGLVEHFYGKDRLAVFKKHIDLCKKGGLIIVFVPYKSIQYALFRSLYKRFSKWIWDEKPFSRKELHELCEHFNLEVLKEHSSPLIHEIGILARKRQ